MKSSEWNLVDDDFRQVVEKSQLSAPVSLSSLAKQLNLKVLSTAMPKGISGEIRPNPDVEGGYIIKVNRNDPIRRQRFTVAHEIGHFLLHRDAIGDGITDDILYRSTLSDRREAEANRIAADILMPEELIQDWLNKAELLKVENVVAFLADKFNVSKAAIEIRLGIN